MPTKLTPNDLCRNVVLRLALALALFVTGCSTTKSTQAKSLKTAGGAPVDLSRYVTVTVVPFTLSPQASAKDPKVGEAFAGNVASRLRNDFGPLFQEVRWKEVRGEANELVLTGSIKTYQPGDPGLRFLLAGLGAASFEGELVLSDGASRTELLRASFDKLWAWGGLLGAGKGIEQMMSETAAAAARTVADGKGWKENTSRK